MSGGFRDSFTKEDTKEDLLGYDDTAFYYFVISVLTCVALPWTLSEIYNLLFPGKAQVEAQFPKKSHEGKTLMYCGTSDMQERMEEARRKARRCTQGTAACWVLKIAALTFIWAGIFGTVMQLGNETEIAKFDPFAILDVTPQAGNAQIKRAYRKLSLVYHPDKNPDDPLAASRFIQITKAYQALTDEVAKRNWEKYGNPDGPQTTKVGIGLPKFLLEKDNNLMILCAFFFVLIIVVPTTFICYYQRTKNYAANGVMIETLQFLGFYILESTRLKSCPELFAACVESRSMATRPTDNAQIKKLAGVIEHKRRTFSLPVIMKNQYLIWAHMQRRHGQMTPELRSDTDELLRHSMKVTQAMIEISCMREWFATAQAMIDFRRYLVQALDVRSSQLLQVPHFTEATVQLCSARKEPITTLAEFLALDADQRRALAKFEADQLLDIEAFCSHVGQAELRACLEVDDESDIVVGDVATVTVQLMRKHLRPDEAMGPAHAPLFPEPKFEEWWFFLVEAETGKPSTRIVHFERILDMERFVEEKLRFQVTRPGKTTLHLHALCDAYVGMDKRIELNFTAYDEHELKREYPVHEEDEELDLQPTLFQQWMGEFTHEESEEEEEDDGKANRDGQKKWRFGKTPKEPEKSGKEGASDDQANETQEKVDAEDSGDSSSGSEEDD